MNIAATMCAEKLAAAFSCAKAAEVINAVSRPLTEATYRVTYDCLALQASDSFKGSLDEAINQNRLT